MQNSSNRTESPKNSKVLELITQDDCGQLIDTINQLEEQVAQLTTKYRPLFHGEHYISGEEVCNCLHISKRTLQEYRDTRVISYIPLFGKILYKESDIIQCIEDNYISAYNNRE